MATTETASNTHRGGFAFMLGYDIVHGDGSADGLLMNSPRATPLRRNALVLRIV